MKLKHIALVIFLVLQPTLGVSQLFPEVEDIFRGEIKTVIQKWYGLEIYLFCNGHYKYVPQLYSGYKTIYKFDNNSNLIQETDKHWCKTLSDCSYQRDTLGNRIIVRQICNYDINDCNGYRSEGEYILDSIGRLKQWNYWDYTTDNKTRALSLIENNARYSGDKLTSYKRYTVNYKGDTIDYGSYIIKYDSLLRVAEVEARVYGTSSKSSNGWGIRERDTTVIIKKQYTYHYNNEGFVDYYKVVNLGDILNFNEEIGSFYIYYYEYDKRGNWIKMFQQYNNNKKVLLTKRKIKYK